MPHAATSAPTPGDGHQHPLVHKWLFARERENGSMHFFKEAKKDDFKARLVVYIYYCDLKVNMLRRGF